MAEDLNKAKALILKNKENQDPFLDLGDLDLTEIPEEVFDLTHLKGLNLGWRFYKDGEWIYSDNKGDHNKIIIVPDLIRKLEKLENLSFDWNPIKELGFLQYLPNLKFLNLSDVKVKDFSQLGAFPQLQGINISYNNSIDLSFLKDIPNLIALDIGFVNVEDYSLLNECTLLTSLGLARHEFVDFSILKGFSKLTNLNFAYNYVERIDGLEHLTELKTLDLRSNRLSKISGLNNLVKLNKLYLEGNWIEEICNVEHLKELKILDLGSNKISKISSLDNLLKLEEFYLESNWIEEICNIGHLRKLKILDIGSNRIRKISGLNNLLQLEELNLKNNRIKEISNINQLKELKTLNIGSNRITKISGLENQIKLEQLDLSNNFLLKIEDLNNLQNLEYLNLGPNQYFRDSYIYDYKEELIKAKKEGNNNNIHTIENLNQCNKLKILDLGLNQIEKVKGGDFPKNLEKLYLDFNQLTDVDDLNQLTSLKVLNLNLNYISKVKELDLPKSLHKLFLGYNNIKNINKLPFNINIRLLDLSFNEIEEISQLCRFKELVTLNLSSNELKEIKGLESLINLQELNLSSNELKEIKGLKSLINLRELNLSSNELKEIKGLEGLVNLQLLHLSSNELKEIKGLEGLINLRELNLSSNELKEIKGLEDLVNLRSLHLSSNELKEIKGLEGLANLKSLFLDLNKLKEIKRLEGLSNLQMLFLGSNELTEIKGLKSLINLQMLYLFSNKLKEIKGLEDLINLQTLFLSLNELEEIKDLEGLVNLQSLHLSSNKLKEIKGLEGLSNLQRLHLDSNGLEDIQGLESLSNLQELDLSSNELKDIQGLESLSNLNELDLSSNEIGDIQGLESLSNLQELNLSSNKLEEIKSLESLSNLQKLNLSSNKLEEIKGLESLSNLQELNLSSNKLEEIKGLESLSNLQELNLSSNKLEEIKGLKSLSNLQKLSLDSNELKEVDILHKLSLLTFLGFAKNKIISFDKEWLRMPYLYTLNVSENGFASIPPEITNQENCLNDAIIWFKALENGNQPNYEAKLILAGNGRVGKTSILKRFFFDAYDPKEVSTHGIQLYTNDYSMKELEEPLRINAWDFGGQEIYHATHRLFMQSRALYLAVWDMVTETTEMASEVIAGQQVFFRNHELPYWLDNVRSLSWRSPLLVIQNKVDRDKSKLPEKPGILQERYEIEAFLSVSAATGAGFATLHSKVFEELKKMPEVGMKTPTAWLNVKQKLLEIKKKEKTIDYEKYTNLCAEEGINSRASDALIRFLHNTGNLYYQRDLFKNQIILDQEWALKGIYAIFERGPFYEMLKLAKGKVSLDALDWPWKSYSTEVKKVFLSMMESCEICFKAEEDKKNPIYIVPEFLPEEAEYKVTSFWKEKTDDELSLEYQHDFFHSAFMVRFISRAGRLAESFDHIWKNGIWITYNKANHALIEAFPEKHQIKIRVKGQHPTNFWFLFLIHKAFREIFYDPDKVSISISHGKKDHVQYKKLKDHKAQGRKKILSKKEEAIAVDDLAFFENILEPEEKKSDHQLERRLKEIVPKPKQKQPDEDIFFGGEKLSQTEFGTLKEQAKKLIRKKLKDAFQELDKLMIDCDQKNDLFNLEGRFNSVRESLRGGLIEYEKADKLWNNIRFALLDLVDGLEIDSFYVGPAREFLNNKAKK